MKHFKECNCQQTSTRSRLYRKLLEDEQETNSLKVLRACSTWCMCAGLWAALDRSACVVHIKEPDHVRALPCTLQSAWQSLQPGGHEELGAGAAARGSDLNTMSTIVSCCNWGPKPAQYMYMIHATFGLAASSSTHRVWHLPFITHGGAGVGSR